MRPPWSRIRRPPVFGSHKLLTPVFFMICGKPLLLDVFPFEYHEWRDNPACGGDTLDNGRPDAWCRLLDVDLSPSRVSKDQVGVHVDFCDASLVHIISMLMLKQV